MSMYVIELTEPATKDIKKLDKVNKKRMLAKLRFFAQQENALSFAKPLKNRADGDYRWRVGNYRVVFEVEDETIVVLRVQHRREVYIAIPKQNDHF